MMSFFSNIKKLFKNIVLNDVKHTIQDTIDVAEEKVNDIITKLEERGTKFIHNLIKSLMLFTMIVVGAIFGLVGISEIIDIPVLGAGSGYLVVGVALIILSVFAISMQKE